MKDKKMARDIRDIQDTLALISGRWRIPILALMCDGPFRFSEIKEELGDISSKVLTEELRFLEKNLMMKREISTIDGKSVLYSITDHGATMRPIILQLLRWSVKHRQILLQTWDTGTQPSDDDIPEPHLPPCSAEE